MGLYQKLTGWAGRTFAGFTVATVVLFLTLVKYQRYFEFWSWVWLAAFGVFAVKAGVQNVAALVATRAGGK